MQPHLAEGVVRLPVLMPFLGHGHKNINSTVDEVGVRKGKGSSLGFGGLLVCCFFSPCSTLFHWLSKFALNVRYQSGVLQILVENDVHACMWG